MQTAYSYIRMSSSEQLKGQSLSRQLEASQRYAAEKGLKLDTSLRDLGISAFTGENRSKGALGRFLSMVQAGEITPGAHLLVESLDRLSRAQVWVALELFMALINAGIVVHTLADRQVYSRESVGENSMQLILSIFVMSRAHEESKRKSERVGDAWARKRRDIASKKLTRRGPHWLRAVSSGDGRAFRFEVIPERSAIVRRILTETAQGLGKRKVAERLNREGVPPFGKGQGWRASYVQKILTDQTVLGRFQPCRKVNGRRVPEGDVILDYYPAIVDADLYARAQAARIRRRHPSTGGRKGQSFSNLFGGLCICDDCGGPLTYRDKGKLPKGGKYLVCDNALRGRGCKNRVHLRYDHLEDAILDHVKEFDFSAMVNAQDRAEEKGLANKLAQMSAETEQLKQRRRKYLDNFESDLVEDAEIAQRVRALRFQIESNDREMAAVRESLQRLRVISQPPDAVEIITTLRTRLAAANPEERYALRAQMAQEIRTVVDEIIFSGETGAVQLVLFMGVRIYLFRPDGSPPITRQEYDKLGVFDLDDRDGHWLFSVAAKGDTARASRLARLATEYTTPRPLLPVRRDHPPPPWKFRLGARRF
jgi:DNA invertase Pin-like site-specific DNA recombinase